MALIKQAPEEGTPQIKDLIGQRFQMDEKTASMLGAHRDSFVLWRWCRSHILFLHSILKMA